ncbi:transcriptional regulator [Pseudomonas putida]|nr:transcriptional regulator [Pseudomonas putida]
MKRYERFADDIAELIRSGVLGPGQRVPSVRYASQTHGVSPSTVFQAYYLLERRGLIRARPRSGYFVNAHAPRQFSEPQALQPVSESTDVDVSALVFSILDSIKDPNTVPFGSAFPSPELFPLQRLSRSLASASRSMDPRMVVTDLSPGNPQLRRQIALRYMVGGLMLPMEELLITNGALEALNLCLQAVTQPGDLVAIEAPAFYACLQVLERLKLKAVEIPVHPREGMDLGVLAQTLEKHPVKAVWCMTNFQNPVGASMPEAKKQALVELLARHQVPLIEDDVYAELYYAQQAPKPAKAFDTQGLVMHCGSFAKSLAPGYRIGWVAAGRFAQKIERLKLMTSLCASMPAQAAIADYLQHGGYDRHLRKLRYALEGQQANMLAAIARHFPAQTRVSQPSGGYFLWLELPEQMDALKLFHMALAQGISIAPGPIFSPTRRFGNCIRLNYGRPLA